MRNANCTLASRCGFVYNVYKKKLRFDARKEVPMTVFEKAIAFAVQVHQGQVRKGGELPYILHPMEVATICATITSDEEVLAAAVLHDTVEDTNVTSEEIERTFGPRVAALVAAETEDKRAELPPTDTWRIRKEESLQVLSAASDPGVKILWLGDKLANMRSFRRAWIRQGDALWSVFNQKDPKQHAWYYRSVLKLLSDLRDTDAWRELEYNINLVFREV